MKPIPILFIAMLVSLLTPNLGFTEIVVVKNGNVGIGTTDNTGNGKHPASPEKTFEVRKNVGAEGVLARFYNTYGPWNGTALIDFMTEYGYPERGRVQIGFVLDSATKGSFIVKTGEAERLRINGHGEVGIGTINPKGKLDVNGAIYQRGSQLHADYVFEPDYQLESIKEHAEFMWKNKHLRAIPKSNIDKEGREIVELGSHRKGIVEELEKAHIYIEQLHIHIKALEESIKNMEDNYRNMEKKFTKLEPEFNRNN